jgi:P-type Cu+ transporter
LREANIELGPVAGEADQLRQEGATVIFVAIDGAAAGVVAISDPIKRTTPGAVAALKGAGIRVLMLTGDNATTARGRFEAWR